MIVAVCALLVGFVAGCGGEQSGGQQDSGAESQQESSSNEGGETSGAQGGGTGGEDGSRENKVALGNISSVSLDNDRFTLRPSAEGEQMVFKLRESTRITLDGKVAKQEDITKGQQAQIKYVVRNERNRARAVILFSAEGNGGGGSTGG